MCYNRIGMVHIWTLALGLFKMCIICRCIHYIGCMCAYVYASECSVIGIDLVPCDCCLSVSGPKHCHNIPLYNDICYT